MLSTRLETVFQSLKCYRETVKQEKKSNQEFCINLSDLVEPVSSGLNVEDVLFWFYLDDLVSLDKKSVGI